MGVADPGGPWLPEITTALAPAPAAGMGPGFRETHFSELPGPPPALGMIDVSGPAAGWRTVPGHGSMIMGGAVRRTASTRRTVHPVFRR